MNIAKKLLSFAAENNYEVDPQPSPTVGSTGYMDMWRDGTYVSGSIGKDMYGRLYMISRPIVFTVDGEEPTTSRVCIFQRYAAEKSSNPHVRNCTALYHQDKDGNLVVEVDDNQSNTSLGIFVQTSERGIADALFSSVEITEERIDGVLSLLTQDTIHLTRQGRLGIPRLPQTSNARECACC